MATNANDETKRRSFLREAMKVLPIDIQNPDQATLEYAARMTAAGAVVVFPSDSCYGRATNAANTEAVVRLYKIKQRPFDKQISCIFRDMAQIKEWGEIGPKEQRTLERNLPGPFTFILHAKAEYPLDSPSLGVRIPNSVLTRSLSNLLNSPYTATSANRGGLDPSYSLEDIHRQFDGQIYQPDVMLDAGRLPQYPPSAVIDIRDGKKQIIREGVARVR